MTKIKILVKSRHILHRSLTSLYLYFFTINTRCLFFISTTAKLLLNILLIFSLASYVQTIYSRDIMCSTSVLGLISMMIFILFLLTNGAVSVLDYGAALTWSKPTLSQPDVLHGEDGDGDSDHSCWERPEEMTTPRTTFKIDDQTLVLILQLRLLLP